MMQFTGKCFFFFFNLHLKQTKCFVYLTNLLFLLTRRQRNHWDVFVSQIWKFQKFHGKTPVLESPFFLEMINLDEDICSAWIKVDLHSANVSHANDAICWWMYFFNLHLMQTKYFVYLTTNLLFLLTTVLQITVGHQQLLIFGSIGWQKKLGNYKNGQPFFTHTKKDFKTAKTERYFFLLISLFNSTETSFDSDTKGMCIRHICV